jgi:hypothetical protein
MMKYDARAAVTPAEQMQKSRQVLEFLKQCFDEKRALDNLIQEELAPLAQLPDAYLWHDHLAPASHPVLFKDFMAHAGRCQLQLLGEATLGVRPVDVLDPETEQAVLQALAEFARGRTLIMATHSPAAMRMAGRVLDLHHACPRVPEASP